MDLTRLRKNKTVLALLKGALALGVLGYLVYAVEPMAIVAVFRQANPWGVAAAAALLPLNLLLEGLTWKQIVHRVAPEAGAWTLGGALLCGKAFGLVTPLRAGDFAARAFYLRRADRWTTGLTVFTQRMLDMVAAIGTGLLALVFALATGVLPPSPAWWIAVAYGASVFLLLAAATLQPMHALAVLRRFVSSEKVLERLSFLNRLTPRRMLAALGLAFGRYLVYITQMVLLVHAFAAAVSLPTAYLGGTLMFFAKFLIPSVTALDLGIREGAAVFFYGALGVDGAVGLSASLVLFVINLVLPAAAGLPFVSRLRLHRTSEAPSSEETITVS